MRRASVLFLTSVLAGCFSPEVSEASDSAETDAGETGSSAGPGSGTDGTGGTDSGDPTGNPTGNPTGPTSTSIDTETDGVDTGPAGDEPPSFESFEVNGSTTPEDVTESSLVELSASVVDDIGVDSVEFFDGETSLGVVTEQPWELGVVVTSSDNSTHVYWATATDTGAQTAESEEVPLVSSVTGGEVHDLNDGLFEGEEVFGIFGGIGSVGDDRLVLTGPSEGSTFEDPETTIVTLDNRVNQINSTTVEAGIPAAPRRFDDGLALIPTTIVVDSVTTKSGIEAITVWRYEVFSVTLGEILPAQALQFTGGNSFNGAAAVESTDGGFALATSPSSLTAYEADLDLELWEDSLGMGAGEEAFVQASESFADGSVAVAILAREGCQGPAENCLRRINLDGTLAWNIALPFAATEGALAKDGQDGLFVGGRVDDGLLLLRLDENGDEQESSLFTFPNPVTTIGAHLVSDQQGGMVVALSTGVPDNLANVPNEVGVVFRLDATLSELWRVNGFGPGSRPVAALTRPTGELYVVGIEAGADLPSAFGTTGGVWATRASL